MAIKISGTTVVDDSRNLVNINSGTIAGIQSGGAVVGAGATTINFIGAGNTFNYNPSTKTLDISIQGGGGIGIQSGGALIGAGITQLNFVGTGNTFRVNGNTVDISISSGNSIIDKQSFNVGAAGTNLVTLTNPYSAGFVDVYLNGLKLSPGDFTETSANVIGLTTAAVQGDTIDVVSFRAVGSIGDVGLKVQQDSVGIGTSISTLNFVGGASTFFNRGNNILDVYVAQGRINKQTFNVGAAGTTLLTLSQPYESGKIDIYRNGIRLASGDFTETSSTTVGLATSAISGDVIEIQSFIGGVNTSAFSLLDNLSVTGIATVNTELDIGVGGTVFTAQNIGSGLVGVGTSAPRYRLEVGRVGASGTSLWVNGDARITGILSIGTGTITLDGSNNTVNIGTGVTITSTGQIQATSISIGSGVSITAAGIVGSASTISFASTAFALSGTPNITVGSVTATSTVVGSAVTINSSGVNVSGAVTATSFTGSGSNITNVLKTAGGTMTGVVTFASGQTYPQIPTNSQTTAYTLVAADAGKVITITTGGVTVPQNIFAAGDAISIYNNSGSNQTITQASGVTLRQVGTTNTGNRTLASYGLVALLCVDTNVFVISGGGLS